ncbi:MAG: tRNA lysidine(34) synthetase TilS [Puniceicoccales bacterium]|nr:tRNA lysidine(34) synthetase TilS [Puniceicoccales bacterium]
MSAKITIAAARCSAADAARLNWHAGALALAKLLPVSRLAPIAVDTITACAQRTEPVAAACSAGADSLAVLLLVWAHFPSLRNRLTVAHFNHATRDECADDAAFTRTVADALGANFAHGEMPVSAIAAARAGALGEEGLRRHRLSFFHATCASIGVRLLVQGHHADDAVESVLLRLARGSGTEGLAAPRPVQTFRTRPLVFVRPLMTLQKEDISSALRKAGILWREDASNASDAYERNRLRQAVTPLWKKVSGAQRLRSGLARSQKLLNEDAAALDALADSLWGKIAERSPLASQGIFDWTPAQNAPAALHRRLFRRTLSLTEPTMAGANAAPRLATTVTDDISLALANGCSGHWNLACNGTAVFDGASLSLFFPTPVPKRIFNGSGILPVGGTLFWVGGTLTCSVLPLTTALFEAVCAGRFSPTKEVFLALREDVVPPVLSVRFWRDGDAYRPLGAAGRRKLSDLFREKKVPVEERHRLPVVLQGDFVVWAPMLPPAEGQRLVQPHGSALRLTWTPAVSIPIH